MKYLKILGLAVMAAAALMAFAGSASATTLKSPTGTTYTGSIIAHLKPGTRAVLANSFGTPIECEVAEAGGPITYAGGTNITVSGDVTTLTFRYCGRCEVTVLTSGTLEIHWTTGYNGTVTASGQEVTTLCHEGGIVGDTHCIWSTSNTDLGTLTGGSPAVLTVKEAEIKRTGGLALCGSIGRWTVSYELGSPSSLYGDP